MLTLGDRGARELLPGVLAPSAVFGAMVAIPFTPWLVWLRAASNDHRRVRRPSLLAAGGARSHLVPVAAAATGGAAISHLVRPATQIELVVAVLGAAASLALAALDAVDLARARRLRARWERAEPTTETTSATAVDFGQGEERRVEARILAAPYRAAAREVLFVGNGDVAVARIRRRGGVDLGVAAVASVVVTLLALDDPSLVERAHDPPPAVAADGGSEGAGPPPDEARAEPKR